MHPATTAPVAVPTAGPISAPPSTPAAPPRLRQRTRRLTVLSVMVQALLFAPAWSAEPIAITTGSTGGVYFKAGEALCRLYRRDAQHPGDECKSLPTAGSVANLIQLRKGNHAFAVVQSDVQYHAYAGTGQFADKGRFEDLRSLFSLHPETVTILARADSGIRRVEDLAGKRIGHGAPGSGSRLGAEQLFDALGLARSRFAQLSPAAPTEAAALLCKRGLDAFILVMGHPADTIAMPIEKCGARLVPLTGPAIDGLLRENRYLVRTAIPGGVYAGHERAVSTYGPLAIIVSTTRVSAEVVYRLVRNTFENLNELKAENPSFAELNNWDMISAGLTAPLHDGAIRYYRERGWIK